MFLAIEVLETANQYLGKKNNKPFYDIKIVGADLCHDLWESHIHINSHDIHQLERPDFIIIPGGSEKNDYLSKKNKALLEWITEQYKSGTELISLCTGSFLIAATGLLNNNECTTHWKMNNLFAKTYPQVRLRSDKIITECKGIYTASGSISSLNLILYLIEKYNDRQTAVYCAKMMYLNMDRNSQSEFVIFEGQKEHEDEAIKKVQTFIEKHIDDKITIDSLAEKFSIPKRSLVRRFQKATQNSPLEYIQRTKMEIAKRNLETNRKSVNEIMYEAGYVDIKAFRNIFKKIVGLSPIQYRKKYNKDFVV